jgi:hypothetical protein
MKKVFNQLMITCFLVVGAGLTMNAQKAMGPEFSSENLVTDFGEVDATKDPGFRVFKFKNTGSEPLMITNAQGSCGCTVPEWPKEPIRPGATGEIKIKYDIQRKGAINKTVTVTTNEVESKDGNGNPIYKNHVIQVKGNVQ